MTGCPCCLSVLSVCLVLSGLCVLPVASGRDWQPQRTIAEQTRVIFFRAFLVFADFEIVCLSPPARPPHGVSGLKVEGSETRVAEGLAIARVFARAGAGVFWIGA